MDTTDKIEIIYGDIAKLSLNLKVDAVVNAAKPTLMGGSGVDGAIHNAIDQINHQGYFKDRIKEELDVSKQKDDALRCAIGNAVVTRGYGLAEYVIHAVGPRWDGEEDSICSKSCIDKLKSCYDAIFQLILKHDFRNVTIPVISSGSFRFPFNLAAKIELASVCNFLTRLRKSDPERYNLINKIYIVVFNEADAVSVQNMLNRHAKCVNKGYQLLYLTTEEAYKAYLKEVREHDPQRNYFGIVRYLRLFLVLSERLFFIDYLLKKCFADKTWEDRRIFIEVEVFFKLLLPLIFLFISPGISEVWGYILTVIAVYLILETLVYTSKLLFLSDIQNPSANNSRSILLLFANYLEINFYFAFFYNLYECFERHGRIQSLYAVFEHSSQVPSPAGMALVCIQSCITLYFVGVVLTHFINNFQETKFNTIWRQ